MKANPGIIEFMQNYRIEHGPTGFRILGPPEGSTIWQYDTEKTRQLRKIRLAESLLGRAKSILDEGNRTISRENIEMREAIAVAASTYYFSVFQTGALSRKLDPNEVFRGTSDALERHNDWRKFRDSRFNHTDSVRRSVASGLIVDPQGKFYDLITIPIDNPISQNHGWMQMLYQLICHVMKYLDDDAEKTFQSIRKDAEKLSAQEISKLPPLKLDIPRE